MNIVAPIRAYLQAHGPATTPQMAKALGLPRRKVQYAVANIARRGGDVVKLRDIPTENGRGTPLGLWAIKSPSIGAGVNVSAPSIFHVG